jgi:hypothetical protein
MTDSLLFCRCRSDFFDGEGFFNETTGIIHRGNPQPKGPNPVCL